MEQAGIASRELVWTETNFTRRTGNRRRDSRNQATAVRTRTPPRVSACAVASRQSTSLRVQRPNGKNAPAPEHRSGSPLSRKQFSAGAPAGISRPGLILPSSLIEEFPTIHTSYNEERLRDRVSVTGATFRSGPPRALPGRWARGGAKRWALDWMRRRAGPRAGTEEWGVEGLDAVGGGAKGCGSAGLDAGWGGAKDGPRKVASKGRG